MRLLQRDYLFCSFHASCCLIVTPVRSFPLMLLTFYARTGLLNIDTPSYSRVPSIPSMLCPAYVLFQDLVQALRLCASSRPPASRPRFRILGRKVDV